MNDAVGGLTKDGPLLCGGYNRESGYDWDPDYVSNDCFTLHNSKFVASYVKLQSERNKASAIVLPNGELWIHGGEARLSKLSSSETVSLQGSKNGMEMEEAIKRHCSVMINSTTAFVTGGKTWHYSYSTYFVNIINWTWTQGPQLKETRADHGCTVFIHNNGQKYAIVAGGRKGCCTYSSTEILDLNNGILEWTTGKSPKFAPTNRFQNYISGPELPVQMDSFPLISTSQGIMAVGGWDYTNGRSKDEILYLKCQDGQNPTHCEWEEYSKKLDVARFAHLVIPLPASYDLCNETLQL